MGTPARRLEAVVPEPPPLIPYYNSSVGLVPASLGLTPQDTFTFYVGENKRVGLLDVGRQRTYYFIDSPLNPEPFAEGTDHREVLRARFTGWCESVQTLIDHADPAVPPQVICDYETLPTYVNGRIVLLGDAAHATTPTLGQGAAMALEDSLVLARQLRSHERLHEALAAYVEERRPRASDVVHLARARTLAMLGVEPDSAAAWYARLKDASVQDFIDQQVEIAATAPALSI